MLRSPSLNRRAPAPGYQCAPAGDVSIAADKSHRRQADFLEMLLEAGLGLFGRPDAVACCGQWDEAKGHFVIEPANLRRQHARTLRVEMMLEIEVSKKEIHVCLGTRRAHAWIRSSSRRTLTDSRANSPQVNVVAAGRCKRNGRQGLRDASVPQIPKLRYVRCWRSCGVPGRP